MNKPVLWVLAIIVALGFLYAVKNYDSETNSIDTSAFNNTISVIRNSAKDMDDAEMTGDIASGDVAEMTGDVASGDVVDADDMDDADDMGDKEVIISNDGYQDFSEEEMKQAVANGKNVALFFHAGRCPSCKALEESIVEGETTIDSNTVIFKVDYDTAKDLTDKYNVTSQHTVVYLDANMNATMVKPGVASLKELVENFGA